MRLLRRIIGWPKDGEADGAIIRALQDRKWRSLYELSEATDIAAGRLSTRLKVMESVKTVDVKWQDGNYPRRRLYKLTERI